MRQYFQRAFMDSPSGHLALMIFTSDDGFDGWYGQYIFLDFFDILFIIAQCRIK